MWHKQEKTMATLSFEQNEDTGLWEAEATVSAGRIAIHLDFEVTEETRTRQVTTEVDVLDEETGEPTGETTTQTTTEEYTVEVDNVSDNFISVGRSASGDNHDMVYGIPFSAEHFDRTFDGLVSGMSVKVVCKNQPADSEGVIL